MGQRIAGAAHRESGEGLVFTVANPGRISEHRLPPFVQDTRHGVTKIGGRHRVDGRLQRRAAYSLAILAQDVTLNDHIT